MSQSALDKVYRAKVETLLGERGATDDRAVRFRDLSQLIGGKDEAAFRAIVREIAREVVREVTGT